MKIYVKLDNNNNIIDCITRAAHGYFEVPVDNIPRDILSGDYKIVSNKVVKDPDNESSAAELTEIVDSILSYIAKKEKGLGVTVEVDKIKQYRNRPNKTPITKPELKE